MDQPDFMQRRKNLFDCLEQAEKSLDTTSPLFQQEISVAVNELQEKPKSSSNKRKKLEVKGFSGHKESIFKRPELPIQKCVPTRRVPDYKINPHKWKKYSLEDTDCSDRTNTAAAFQFLREIEQRKEDEKNEANSSNQDELPNKILFKKSSKLKAIEEQESLVDDEKPRLRGSKVVMPEYVIGQKQIKEKRKHKVTDDSSKSNKRKEMKLDHLFDEEDEEDNGLDT